MKMKDSRGRESTTLTFVWIAFAALTVKFILGGMTLGPIGAQPVIDASGYGIAIAGVLAIWLGREYQARPKGENGVTPQT